MTAAEKASLIDRVEGSRCKRRLLRALGIPDSTYYHWVRLYREGGPNALDKLLPVARTIWNRITPKEELRVLEIARDLPELSPRLLSVKITDEEEFAISESKVYEILKKNDLIRPRPLPELPARSEWPHKTRRPNEIWQIDATTFFVAGWGYYKLIPVLDDYSRKILAWDLLPDESAGSISNAVEQAVEATGIPERPEHEKPTLLSDNGSGFISWLLADYLKAHGIRHIFGKPYHPQTQGKIERFNRRIKEGECLIVYLSPGDLKEALKLAIVRYNATPHEALKNVAPNDLYAGRQEEILRRREEKKKATYARRKEYNRGVNNGPAQPGKCD
ncbi:MAG: transposase [Nitrospirae bacterium]|nr:transposase [Nitrospirota bacterium]